MVKIIDITNWDYSINSIHSMKYEIIYSRNCAELSSTELLFHLKINNFISICDLQIYVADTRTDTYLSRF